ncbi:Cna B-type domain-containing protein [Bifidobacterium dentium]|uniref:Cna B-type domain-containing protein n=1 Tax=Bifidobacterium dentium TaxID=1689 RepID=UPI0018C2E41B|nr:Cna B-type domain-containing protein [Bifidobacterium dentium]MBF9708166.1 Cna B-type domain-containing protein [Bifidobacterium dentium]
MRRAKRWMSIILSLTLCMFMGFTQAVAQAAPEGKAVNVDFTNFEIQNTDHKKANEIYHTSAFLLSMDWDASSYGINLHEGDYFDVTLPDTFKFPNDVTAQDFDLLDPNGNVVAKAHVTPGADENGGTVRATFTKTVENKYNVKGTMYLVAKFNTKKVVLNEKNTFTVQIGSTYKSGEVTVVGPHEIEHEVLNKWAGKVDGKPNNAQWYVRINHMKSTLHNVVISDTLDDPTQSYIPGSFELQKVVFNKYGDVSRVLETVNIDSKLTISGNSFTLNLGDVNGDQYHLTYQSTYTSGKTLKNKLMLTSDEETKSYEFAYRSAESGGTGDGDLANKIKLIKVEEGNENVKLANAVFTVTKPDGSTFELTTGADGTVTSGTLEQGTYKVKEKVAPTGYKLNDKEYTLTVTSSKDGAIQTVTDKPITTKVKVSKKWVGPRSGSVSVHLLADGVDTGQSLILDEAGDWKGAFTDLRKYTADGRQIAYTVSEDPVDGYTGEVTGDMASGFTVTNTNVQTTRVAGTKTWDDDGNRDGVRPDSITVNLLRDGKKVDAVQVSAGADGSWTYAFENLPKYDRHDGHRYDYTVGEDAVKDYATKVDGFDLTNSYTPGKTLVSVSKVWKDSNDKEHRRPKSVKVQLYADGVAQGAPVELSEANHWANTWTGLYQKKSGKSVAYTVKEIGTVDGYTGEVTGDMASGFTVTNTVNPTPEKPATPSKSTPDKPVKKTMAATGSSLIVPGVVLAVLVVVAALAGGIAYFMRRRENK